MRSIYQYIVGTIEQAVSERLREIVQFSVFSETRSKSLREMDTAGENVRREEKLPL